LDVVRGALTILIELTDAATDIVDLQGELPTEINQACVMMRKKLAKTVEAKSMYANMVEEAGYQGEDDANAIEQITIYLEMIDHIDNGLKSFNEKYLQLK